MAAWVFERALIYGLQAGDTSPPLAELRARFAVAHSAPPGCAIHAGPAPSTPFTVAAIPEVAALALFGVRAIAGRMNLTRNIQAAN